jgi:hypothetical protein
MTNRRAGAMLVGALAGAWIGRAIFNWILDVDGTVLIVLIVAVAALGALAGMAAEAEGARE